MPTTYVLVGNIASGKSTLSKTLGCPVVSKDALRYIIGGGDYRFDPDIEPYVHAAACSIITLYSKAGIDFCVDATNMTVKSRKMVIELIPPEYHITCYVGTDRGEDSHVAARLSDNHGTVSEETWRRVYREFNTVFEMPTMDEGFSEIRYF